VLARRGERCAKVFRAAEMPGYSKHQETGLARIDVTAEKSPKRCSLTSSPEDKVGHFGAW
jgi:hypothetical protein